MSFPSCYPSDSALTVGPSKPRHEEVTDRSLKMTELWKPHPGAPSPAGDVWNTDPNLPKGKKNPSPFSFRFMTGETEIFLSISLLVKHDLSSCLFLLIRSAADKTQAASGVPDSFPNRFENAINSSDKFRQVSGHSDPGLRMPTAKKLTAEAHTTTNLHPPHPPAFLGHEGGLLPLHYLASLPSSALHCHSKSTASKWFASRRHILLLVFFFFFF